MARLDTAILPQDDEPTAKGASPHSTPTTLSFPILDEGNPLDPGGTEMYATANLLADQPAASPQPVSGLGRSILRNFSVVMIAFVLSRVLGLLRDVVIAARFDQTERDAYYAAFRIPDTIFLLVVGGAVSSAFIPVFSAQRAQGKDAAAWRLASTLINLSIILVSLFGIVAALLAPQIIGGLIAPGYTGEKLQLTINLTTVLMLSPLFMGLGAWAQGILNAEHRFVLSAFAPIFYNLGIIVGALFFAPYIGPVGLAWGVVLGAILHIATQVPGLLRLGMKYQLRLNLRDAGTGEVLRLIGPRVVGQIAFQANFIIITSFASSNSGWVNAVNYAFTLMMLPFGVFALSLSTVVFPTLAEQFGRREVAQMRVTVWGGVRLLVFLSAVSSVFLLVMREPIVRLLYQRNKFTASDTAQVADALLYFSLGLISYAVVEVLTRSFYAMHDTRTPVVIALITVAVNFLCCLLFVGPLGQGGLALALVLSTTAELLILLLTIRRRFSRLDPQNAAVQQDERRAISGALKSIGAAAVVGLLLQGYLSFLAPIFPAGLFGQLLSMSGAGLLAVVAYLALSLLLGNAEARQLSALITRRLRR